MRLAAERISVSTCRWSRILAWGLWLVLAATESHALTKILVVPTARTMGAGRYAIDLDRKESLFDASLPRLTLTTKAGITDRAQLEMKIPLRSGGDRSILFNGKYTFASADGKRTVAAVGFENFGSGSRIVPYVALSRLFARVDLTLGFARGVGDVAVYFAGIDYHPSKSLHGLADYNTGPTAFAAIGFQYDFSGQWALKTGLEARHDSRADLMVKLSYSGTY